ncbi:MAG: hypothetical protein IJU28_03110 [Clostridia bacterium]|nr:hypothetical protein [Clostridia bacterium]
MAIFKYDSLNEKLMWLNCFAAFDDDDFGASSSDDDGYLDEDEDSDAEEYEDDAYDDEEYEDDGEYDDTEYDDDAEYDEGEYEDGGEEYEDDGEEYEDDAEYDDDAEYEDDADYDGEEEYDDDELYGEDGEEEYEDEDLGYNPAVFKNLDGEEEEYEYDEDNGEEYYDDNPMDEEGEYPEEEGFENEAGGGWLDRVKEWLDNDYVLYALCALIPLLALYLIWRRSRFDNQKKWILTGIAVVCLIIWMIICWPFGGSNDNTAATSGVNPDFSNQSALVNPTDDFQFNPDVQPSATADATVTDPVVSPTAHVTSSTDSTTGNTGTINQSDIVWSTNASVYYHTKSDCGGMTGATSMTLEAALQRGKTACPDCAGGTNKYADNTTPTTFYATSGGTWYHTDPTCQGMTGASQVTESAAIQAGKSACPVCIGYYGTTGGTWYHSISNCQGMQNAITKTEAEWKALGKTACPTCLGGSNTVKTKTQPTETQVYATTTGTYFHTISDCSGMKGASQVAVSRAVSSGKKACPRCVSPSKVYVFATQGGTYYHTKANCSGMTGASYITQKQAINAGKSACSKCNARSLGSSSASTDTTPTAVTLANTNNKTTAATTLNGKTTQDTATYVYATKNGTYYHTKSNCSGMKGATRITYSQALSAGKKACPTCITAANVNVFATQGGKYFHTKANCSGMTGAVQVSVSKALSAGKTACPTCAKSLGTATATKASSAAAQNNTAAATKTAANANPVKASAETNVYITVGSASGSYYHKAAKCAAQNFSGGINVTLEYALGHGYKACPSCQPPKSIA